MGGIYLKNVISAEPVLSRVEGAGIHAIYASLACPERSRREIRDTKLFGGNSGFLLE